MYSLFCLTLKKFVEMWIRLNCSVLLDLWFFNDSCIIYYKIIILYSIWFLMIVNLNCFINRFIKLRILSSFEVSVKKKYKNLSHWAVIELYQLVVSLINFSDWIPLFIHKYRGIVVGLKLHSSIITIKNFVWFRFSIKLLNRAMSWLNPGRRNLVGLTLAFLHD